MAQALSRGAFYAVLAFFTLFSIFPFVFSVLTSLKEPGKAFAPGIWPERFTLSNYIEVVQSTPLFLQWVVNSVLVAGVSVGVLVLLAMMGGYAFARIAFPGRDLLFVTMLATMMIPGQVLWIPNYATLANLGWINTYWALIPAFVGTLTSGIFMVSQFLKAMPKELEEAALIDGLSRYSLFWRIIVPLAGPVIGTMTITSFMASWNSFAWPVIVLNSPELFTLPIGLNFFKGLYITKWTLIMAGSMFNTIPVLLVFMLFQRYFVKGIATAGMKD
ncbi:MAG: carbohydrate ABC transporter permease [Candidatus Sericytochromatia bacterium]|nr:carbohydrate ABC transporter permease [Candidatus Tanganyikabacteria bacterium]